MDSSESCTEDDQSSDCSSSSTYGSHRKREPEFELAHYNAIRFGDALRCGAVLHHGRLQALDAQGCVINDCSADRVQPEWRGPLEWAMVELMRLPSLVPGLELVSVYVRGSVPRGLALAGRSDLDMLGYAVLHGSNPRQQHALEAWHATADARNMALRASAPHVARFDFELMTASANSRLGRWLLSDGSRFALTRKEQDSLNAFRLKSQALWLQGARLADILPACPAARPRLLRGLVSDVKHAKRECPRVLRAGDAHEAVRIGQWVLKRCLRAGMELAVMCGYPGFSRDLVPCCEALLSIPHLPASSVGGPAVEALLLACCPEPSTLDDAGDLTMAMLSAASALAAGLKREWCDSGMLGDTP